MEPINLKALPDIPDYALDPETWAKESAKRAADYAGMPESTWFLMDARRFMALDKQLKQLQTEIQTLKGTI
jgi:hypothetical protein